MILTDDDLFVLQICIDYGVAYRTVLLDFAEFYTAARRLMARGVLYHVFGQHDCYALSAKGTRLVIELGLADERQEE